MNEDGLGWRRLTRTANDQLEKCTLNFSRCTNRDVAPLMTDNSVYVLKTTKQEAGRIKTTQLQ